MARFSILEDVYNMVAHGLMAILADLAVQATGSSSPTIQKVDKSR
jgi:hypothetical protein